MQLGGARGWQGSLKPLFNPQPMARRLAAILPTHATLFTPHTIWRRAVAAPFSGCLTFV
ncbi:hypothetical protein [Kingella sp. (in: b-proteobacteria)]|uniref:hypothetical protein n=1 Tax=Kingella sp. (in: b-proteobacteria) TaxID=2020713 RepID=UPI0026DBD93D|nr:hypothetical protein [Kingella sp. (in: b-proteobacteria)]MDO4658717.1 hypothetical protein [Kingella sp. (in: b-proteobacteria)]